MRTCIRQPAVDRRFRPSRGTCRATGKVRYRDPREATDALHRLLTYARRADEDGIPHGVAVRRKYPCKACRGWHLTSWETPTGGSGRGTTGPRSRA